MANNNPYPATSIQGVIVDLLAEGPLVGFYFSTAVLFLKERIDNMPDEELEAEFGGLLSAERIRHNVGAIARRFEERIGSGKW